MDDPATVVANDAPEVSEVGQGAVPVSGPVEVRPVKRGPGRPRLSPEEKAARRAARGQGQSTTPPKEAQVPPGPGGSPSQLPPDQAPPSGATAAAPAPSADYEKAAKSFVALEVMVGCVLCSAIPDGGEISPIPAPDEEAAMVDEWRRYCEASQLTDIPPGVALAIGIGRYYGLRVFRNTVARSRWSSFWSWVGTKAPAKFWPWNWGAK